MTKISIARATYVITKIICIAYGHDKTHILLTINITINMLCQEYVHKIANFACII